MQSKFFPRLLFVLWDKQLKVDATRNDFYLAGCRSTIAENLGTLINCGGNDAVRVFHEVLLHCQA